MLDWLFGKELPYKRSAERAREFRTGAETFCEVKFAS